MDVSPEPGRPPLSGLRPHFLPFLFPFVSWFSLLLFLFFSFSFLFFSFLFFYEITAVFFPPDFCWQSTKWAFLVWTKIRRRMEHKEYRHLRQIDDINKIYVVGKKLGRY